MIVTVNAPLADAVHDRDEMPDPVTLVGLTVQPSPMDGDTVVVRPTTLAKPFTGVIVIVEVAVPEILIDAEVGLALIVKSWITNVTVVV